MRDSFVFGVGAEEDQTIPRLIETYLREQGKDVEVINAGFGSFSPLLHYMKMKDEYLEFSPDLVKIPMLLVIYPYGIHVAPDEWGTEREYWGFEKGKIYDDYFAFELLEDYAKRNNIPCINVLPAFLSNSEKALFFDIDGHFTPEANRVAAEAVVKDSAFAETLNNIERSYKSE